MRVDCSRSKWLGRLSASRCRCLVRDAERDQRMSVNQGTSEPPSGSVQLPIRWKCEQRLLRAYGRYCSGLSGESSSWINRSAYQCGGTSEPLPRLWALTPSFPPASRPQRRRSICLFEVRNDPGMNVHGYRMYRDDAWSGTSATSLCADRGKTGDERGEAPILVQQSRRD